MIIRCSILAWRTPRTKEPGGLQPMWSQSVTHDWAHMQLCTGRRRIQISDREKKQHPKQRYGVSQVREVSRERKELSLWVETFLLRRIETVLSVPFSSDGVLMVWPLGPCWRGETIPPKASQFLETVNDSKWLAFRIRAHQPIQRPHRPTTSFIGLVHSGPLSTSESHQGQVGETRGTYTPTPTENI